MSPPKAVIFDLGKVLLDFDYTIAARKLIEDGQIKIKDLATLFTKPAEVLLRYETGLLTSRQFYNEICTMTGYRGDMEAFAGCFGDIFTPIQPMINAQAAIRKNGLPTYIFSNTNELAIQHIRASYPFMSNFDGMILSYEHKAMKPEPPLYEVVERTSGFKGADLLYIDDRPENIATGQARGWRVILQEQPEKTISEMKQQGVL